MIDISTAELRKGLGEILNQVQYGGSSFVVKRKGREVGAIVPVELARELELLQKKRQTAKDRLLQMMNDREGLNQDVSEEALMEEAVHETRAARRAKR
ncbi:MAG: type II toxin-antitoxin system prevent-host-death family antitoxin [Myxococcota bacterium]|nr:type II toxin-antitoxin system prevent-host-death family antitoxin [Myxococcota bacterium]